MSACCICEKELKPYETFGPLNFPVCEKHRWEYESKLWEINALGRCKKQDVAFSQLIGSVAMTKGERRIAELERKIAEYEEAASDLEDQLSYYNFLVHEARHEIDDIMKRSLVKAAKANHDQQNQ